MMSEAKAEFVSWIGAILIVIALGSVGLLLHNVDYVGKTLSFMGAISIGFILIDGVRSKWRDQ